MSFSDYIHKALEARKRIVMENLDESVYHAPINEQQDATDQQLYALSREQVEKLLAQYEYHDDPDAADENKAEANREFLGDNPEGRSRIERYAPDRDLDYKQSEQIKPVKMTARSVTAPEGELVSESKEYAKPMVSGNARDGWSVYDSREKEVAHFHPKDYRDMPTKIPADKMAHDAARNHLMKHYTKYAKSHISEEQLDEAIMKPERSEVEAKFAQKHYNDKHKTNFPLSDVRGYLHGGDVSDDFHSHVQANYDVEDRGHIRKAFGPGLRESIEPQDVDMDDHEQLHSHMNDALTHGHDVEIQLGDGSFVTIEPHQIQHIHNKKSLPHMFGSLSSIDDFQSFLDKVYSKSEPSAFHGPDMDNFSDVPKEPHSLGENHIPVGKEFDTEEGKMKVTKHVDDDTYEVRELEEGKDPCWDGHEMVGMKEKDGKKVPNCVPVSEDQLDELSTDKLRGYTAKAMLSDPKDDRQYKTRSKGLNRASEIIKDRLEKSQNSLKESLVDLDDGRDYGDEPSSEDVAHVKSALKQHGGTYHSTSDKATTFKFPSKEHATKFVNHVRSNCKTCFADHVSESMAEEKIEEISKDSLKSYVKSAIEDKVQQTSSDSFKSGKAGDFYNKSDDTPRTKKRDKGIDLALDKLSRTPKSLKEGEIKLVGRLKKQSVVGVGEPLTVHVPGRGPVSGKVASVDGEHAVVVDSQGNHHRVSLS